MITTNFINDCVKCISMCNKEFSGEFAEWIEKLILTEVAGNSNDKSDVEKIAKDLKKCIEIRQNRGTKITIDDNGTLLLGRNIKFNRK